MELLFNESPPCSLTPFCLSVLFLFVCLSLSWAVYMHGDAATQLTATFHNTDTSRARNDHIVLHCSKGWKSRIPCFFSKGCCTRGVASCPSQLCKGPLYTDLSSSMGTGLFGWGPPHKLAMYLTSSSKPLCQMQSHSEGVRT